MQKRHDWDAVPPTLLDHVPGTQVLHVMLDVDPILDEYDPGWHAKHPLAPKLDEKRPAAHVEHVTEDWEEYVPGRHDEQNALSLAPSVPE